MRLEQVSALVTGGVSGLGLATSGELTARGAAVTLIDLATSDGAAAAEKLGPRARFVAADVTDPEAVGAALDAASQTVRLDGALRMAPR